MPRLFIDFETYFDARLTLKKMPGLLYIRDPYFLVHGAAVKVDCAPSQWLDDADLRPWLQQFHWPDVELVGHNSNFDFTLLYEQYGHSPGLRVDTLAMCRMLLSHDLDFDLDSICEMLGLGNKLPGALNQVKGVRALSSELRALLAEYAIHDVDLTYALFNYLWPHVPEQSKQWMDVIIQASTEGALHFDRSSAVHALSDAQQAQVNAINASGTSAEVLRSNPQFAEALRSKGVEPPTKISKRTGKSAYAFSKDDPEFIDLLTNPKIAPLVRGRMAAMSDSEINRIQKLIAITDSKPHTLPAQLNISGAHTHRLSGGGGINMQNLNRGSTLRRALHAAPDHVLLVADSSQIELRMNLWFSGEKKAIDFLTPGEYKRSENKVEWKGADYYSLAAMKRRGLTAEQITKDIRQFEKVVVLGCGYGMGAQRFRRGCAAGMMGNPPVYLTDEEAAQTIQSYRHDNPFVVRSWATLQNDALPAMTMPNPNLKLGPITIEHEAILLPDGMRLLYPNLEPAEDGWTWGLNGATHRPYGGILQENVIQALAAVVIKQQAWRALEQFKAANLQGVRLVLQVHDELVFQVPESNAGEALEILVESMSWTPDWAPGLPLRCEAMYDRSYAK